MAHIVNASLRGIDGEAIVMALDIQGVYVSSGSACASASLEPSPVLMAMGLARAQARGSVRFSFGADSTDADVDRALAIVPGIVERLRRISPVA
jgi:cysteine desulfurase